MFEDIGQRATDFSALAAVTMNAHATLRDEAAAWVTRVYVHTPSARVRAEFAAWLERSPEHSAAFADAERTWRDLEAMRLSPQYEHLLGEPTLRERLVAFLRPTGQIPRMAGAAAVALLVVAAFFGPALIQRPSQVETRVAEVRDIELPDGSQVTLGAQSRLAYAFSADARRVTLAGGDAFFTVTKDPSRPFYVSVDDIRVKVVGTQFEVRRRLDEVSVAVAEGVVEVSRGKARQAQVQVLRKGESLVAQRTGQVAAVREVDTKDVGTWRAGRLAYDDVELRDVIADANRYSRGRIVIDDPQLARMRVTTSFPASQVDAMIETLEGALPLASERLPNGDVVLRPRP